MFDFKNKKILVTGGAGFIGSNLCSSLLKLGAKVVCLDNFSTGYEHNIDEIMNDNNFSLIEGDITNLSTCQRACKNQDFVLHQAALGSVPRSIENPIKSNEVNITGFLNMLVAARDNKIKRFVFAASSSTYGDSIKLPKYEDEIGNPLSPYAITKYVNELYAEIFNKHYGLNYIGLRYFNVFGKNQDPNGAYAAVIPKFIKKLINIESPVVNGDGSFSRDFTYIDNVVLMNCLALSTKNHKALNQIYNTACGERTTINKLLEILKFNLSKLNPKINNVDINYGPERIGDVHHSLASIDKSVNMLGYKPTHNITQGLEQSIEWYWKNL